MASEPAKCGKQRPEPARRERKGFLFICSSLAAMLCDLERVRAALRAGAQPQQVHGINALTRRTKQPDTIAHGPDGDVLILGRWGRVTMLGRMWDEERAERARSRSPCVKGGETQVPSESKGANTGTIPYAPDP